MKQDKSPYRNVRRGLALLGVSTAVAALSADWIGIGGGGSGFGETQVLLSLIGVGLVLLAAFVPDSLMIQLVCRPLLAVVAAYLALLICECAVYALSPRLKSPAWALRGRYMKDETTGYKLAPGFRGYYNDGIVKAEYRTNSLGHRDDEPHTHEGPRVLLLGDSFAYGHALDQSETIDKHIERLAAGGIDAYNLGVSGYGSPGILERFRSCEWFAGTDVVYLFYSNDLRFDNLVPDLGYTVSDGYLVPKYKAEGVRYTEEDYSAKRAELQELERPRLWLSTARSRLNLRSVRALVSGAWNRFRDARDLELRLLCHEGSAQSPFPWRLWQYSPENVDKVMTYTEAMRDLAAERGMNFHVAIIPTKEETRYRRYAELVALYVRKLGDRGINVIEFIDRITLNEYFRHDGHLNPSGAKCVAAAIIEGTDLNTRVAGFRVSRSGPP
ncbi:MAG: hypothetical protein V1790_19635 [Planctomycetota bacterium]